MSIYDEAQVESEWESNTRQRWWRRKAERERDQDGEVWFVPPCVAPRAVTLQAGFPALDIKAQKPAQRCKQNNQGVFFNEQILGYYHLFFTVKILKPQ